MKVNKIVDMIHENLIEQDDKRIARCVHQYYKSEIYDKLKERGEEDEYEKENDWIDFGSDDFSSSSSEDENEGELLIDNTGKNKKKFPSKRIAVKTQSYSVPVKKSKIEIDHDFCFLWACFVWTLSQSSHRLMS